jgi:methyl acetate hydrolase
MRPFPGMPETWGLTFMINTADAPPGRSAGSLAWAGSRTRTSGSIRGRASVGCLTQVLPFADKKSLPLLLEFERTVYRNLS